MTTDSNPDGCLIPLSEPTIGMEESTNIAIALSRNELTAGGFLSSFEAKLSSHFQDKNVVLVNSGTAALHLVYKALGVDSDYLIIIPTVTFAATAFAGKYLGARCLFIDIAPSQLTLDFDQLEDALKKHSDKKILVVAVDLYGVPNDYARISKLAKAFGVPFIVDAAESLGSQYHLGEVSDLADAVVYSFNGNKIITTAGGGAIVTQHNYIADKCRVWRNQSKLDFEWYEHEEVGYNYRMSNISAAIGVAQLSKLESFVDSRIAIRENYSNLLSGVEEVQLHGDPTWGKSNGWLTTVSILKQNSARLVPRLILNGRKQQIEIRRVWKPLHLQPVFESEEKANCKNAEHLFESSVSLPSSPNLSLDQQIRVIRVLTESLE